MTVCRTESLDHHYALVEHQYRLQDKCKASIDLRKAKKHQAETKCEESAREHDKREKTHSSIKSLDTELTEAITKQQEELAFLKRLRLTRLAILELDRRLAENEKMSAVTEAHIMLTLSETKKTTEATEKELNAAIERFSELETSHAAITAQHTEKDSALTEHQDSLSAIDSEH